MPPPPLPVKKDTGPILQAWANLGKTLQNGPIWMILNHYAEEVLASFWHHSQYVIVGHWGKVARMCWWYSVQPHDRTWYLVADMLEGCSSVTFHISECQFEAIWAQAAGTNFGQDGERVIVHSGDLKNLRGVVSKAVFGALVRMIFGCADQAQPWAKPWVSHGFHMVSWHSALHCSHSQQFPAVPSSSSSSQDHRRCWCSRETLMSKVICPFQQRDYATWILPMGARSDADQKYSKIHGDIDWHSKAWLSLAWNTMLDRHVGPNVEPSRITGIRIWALPWAPFQV